MNLLKFQFPSLKTVAVMLTHLPLPNFGKYIVRFDILNYSTKINTLLKGGFRENDPAKLAKGLLDLFRLNFRGSTYDF